MNLRERDSSPPVPLSVGKQLSHPPQAVLIVVLIAALLRPDVEERGIPTSFPWTPLDLACDAGYSRMTASQVAREQVAANLVSAQRGGRGTSLRLPGHWRGKPRRKIARICKLRGFPCMAGIQVFG
ncbi:hypothetical protein D3C71_579640 [compost metagenome]